jgi:hypothetical protein
LALTRIPGVNQDFTFLQATCHRKSPSAFLAILRACIFIHSSMLDPKSFPDDFALLHQCCEFRSRERIEFSWVGQDKGSLRRAGPSRPQRESKKLLKLGIISAEIDSIREMDFTFRAR